MSLRWSWRNETRCEASTAAWIATGIETRPNVMWPLHMEREPRPRGRLSASSSVLRRRACRRVAMPPFSSRTHASQCKARGGQHARGVRARFTAPAVVVCKPCSAAGGSAQEDGAQAAGDQGVGDAGLHGDGADRDAGDDGLEAEVRAELL